MPAKRSRPKTVEEGLRKLAMGPVNDSVKLVTQPLDQPIPIEGLDLFHIKEIKTNKEGMEIKFYDRLEALKCLDALQQRREELHRRAAFDRGENHGDILFTKAEGCAAVVD